MKKLLIPSIACTALLGSGAYAQQAGDWVLSAGWLHLMPQEKASPLTLTAPVYQPVIGSSASVSNANTLGLGLSYFVNPNFSLMLEAGIPPTFKLYGGGTLARVGKIGEAKQWSPVLIAKYHFGDAQATVRPFVGLGVGYVWFNSIKLTPSLQSSMTSLLHQRPGTLVTSADLRSSFAPLATAGLNWKLTDHWGLGFSLSYMKLKTKATLTTTTITGLPAAVSSTTMKLNPLTTNLSATYRF